MRFFSCKAFYDITTSWKPLAAGLLYSYDSNFIRFAVKWLWGGEKQILKFAEGEKQILKFAEGSFLMYDMRFAAANPKRSHPHNFSFYYNTVLIDLIVEMRLTENE